MPGRDDEQDHAEAQRAVEVAPEEPLGVLVPALRQDRDSLLLVFPLLLVTLLLLLLNVTLLFAAEPNRELLPAPGQGLGVTGCERCTI